VAGQAVAERKPFRTPPYAYRQKDGKSPKYKGLRAKTICYSVLYLLAMQQVHVNTKGQARNPLLRAYFENKVSAGKTKIQALLCIMRRLVNIIYSARKDL